MARTEMQTTSRLEVDITALAGVRGTGIGATVSRNDCVSLAGASLQLAETWIA